MKKIILLLLIAFSVVNLTAQNSTDYIEEVYSLFKIKSFNPTNDTKKCEILAYVRTTSLATNATYHIRLIPNEGGDPIFVDLIDFNNLSSSVVAKSHRQKGNVYEFNFGEFYVTEYAKMDLVIIYSDDNNTVIPIEMTNYKNPITIMN